MENTAKNFALQLGSLIALYVSIGSLLTLLFGIITIAFPDAADSYYIYDAASSQIRFSIATLIVFFPVYLVLTRMVNTVRRTEHGTYLTLTKWLIYLSLLVGGIVILGDFVAVINSFLNGEITTRFVLKALSILVVVGTAFSYYLLDARGHWQKNEKQSIQYGAGAAIVVVAVLVLGFFHTETPAQVREIHIDDLQVQALNEIQWRIEEHYRVNGELPESINKLYVGLSEPTASEGRGAYEYNVQSADRFELCAEFIHPSTDQNEFSSARPMFEPGAIKNPYNWDHGTGRWCFERVIMSSN